MVQTRLTLVAETPTGCGVQILILGHQVREAPLPFLHTWGVAPVHDQGFERGLRLGRYVRGAMRHLMQPTTHPERTRPEKVEGFDQAKPPPS